MKLFFTFLLLLSTTLYPANKIRYFNSLDVEKEDGEIIQKVYSEPSNENTLYYVTQNKVYQLRDGVSRIVLDLEIEDSNNSENEDSLKNALKELYEQIYEEEKEIIEDEFSVDDAEEYYDDLLKERIELRMAEESTSIKEEYGNNKSKEKNISLDSSINDLIFIGNSPLNIAIKTSEGIYISTDRANNFKFQSNLEISNILFGNINLKNPLFVINNKLYTFDDNEISIVTFEMYDNKEVESIYSFYPYLTVLTEKGVILFKQNNNSLKLMNKIEYQSKDATNISYFGGDYIFLKSENDINIIKLSTNYLTTLSLPDYKVNDFSYKDEALYLATDRGFILYDFQTQEIEDLSLGLIPEIAKNIALSIKDSFFVTNSNDVYFLKEFESLKELEEKENLFSIMKKIDISYPTIDEILLASNRHNFLKDSGMSTRSTISLFLPKLQITSRWNYKNLSKSDLRYKDYSRDFNNGFYFQAFLYFDLSKWIFDSQELPLNKYNNDKNIFKNMLTEELVIYYNNRKLMDLLFHISNNAEAKLNFKMKMLEYGTIINQFTGKNFF